MQHIIPFIILSICIIFSDPVAAFQEQELTEVEIEELMLEWEPLEVTGDAIPWSMFAKTKENNTCTIDEEGYDYCIVKPEYSQDIMKLNNTEVTLMGFMFPLEQADKQHNFLIGPYPLSCPFHYHIGPSQVIEVIADEAIDFSYDPITIKGRLSIRFNEETNMFYYLENAKEK